MGLDLVELVMEVEEQFDVKISDSDYSEISTVGDFHKYICDAKEAMRPKHCLSSAAFLRLRRSLMSTLGIARDRVRLQTSLDDLIPRRRRRTSWDRLRKSLGLNLPDLERPEWMRNVLIVWAWSSILVFAVWGISGLLDPIHFRSWSILMIPLGILIAILPYLATIPCANAVPAECLTVRGISQTLFYRNLTRLAELEGVESEPTWQIYDKLTMIISEHLGVPLGEILPESRFIEDLHCD